MGKRPDRDAGGVGSVASSMRGWGDRGEVQRDGVGYVADRLPESVWVAPPNEALRAEVGRRVHLASTSWAMRGHRARS
eukprot:ctg_2345.g548